MTFLLISELLPWVTTTIWIRRLTLGATGRVIAILCAGPLGAGVASLSCWLLLQSPLYSRWQLVTIDWAMWISLAFWGTRGGITAAVSNSSPTTPRRLKGARWIVAAICVGLLCLFAISFTTAVGMAPHGVWDAWAIWNARARFIARAWPTGWSEAFAQSPTIPHADYPLLLPLSIARIWLSEGRQSIAVPIIEATVFTSCLLGVVGASVARSRGVLSGLIAAAILAASPALPNQGAAQISDVPLAFFIVVAGIFSDLAMETRAGNRSWFLVGLFASLAAWTKNEGLMFCGAFLALASLWLIRQRNVRALAFMLVGAAPAVLALIVFHIRFAPRSEYATAILTRDFVAHTMNVAHLKIILEAMGRELWKGGALQFGPFPVLILIVAAIAIERPVPPAVWLALSAVGCLCLVDVIVYANTPYDLKWQLAGSVDRLMMQMFPTLVWCAMRAARPA